jgi:tetraacyldisaccharide 4'-kinase
MKEYIYSLMTDEKSGIVASVLKFFLLLFSLLYLLAIKIIFILREVRLLPTTRLKVKVVSIGNLTMGGTGKTPLVEKVVNYLAQRGKKVGVLTRGYKIAVKAERSDSDRKTHLFEEIGDEPALLRLKLPTITILVGSNRIKNGNIAIRDWRVNVLVLDDGFQCWELDRDVDILAIDTTNPFGNRKLLPRGILREPISHLSRADVVVMTKTNIATSEQAEAVKNKVKSLNPRALIVSSVHKPSRVVDISNKASLQLEWLKDKEFVIVCAIGDPAYFIKILENLGAVVKDSLIFEDHHPYSLKDLLAVSDKCKQISVKRIMVTEKDMVKLEPLLERRGFILNDFPLEFFALGIDLDFTNNEDEFIERILIDEKKR